MAQYNRNNWHHIPGISGIMATGVSKQTNPQEKSIKFNVAL
jgi:hypothetical protein